MNRLYTYFPALIVMLLAFSGGVTAQDLCVSASSNGFSVLGSEIDCADPKVGGRMIELQDNTSGLDVRYHYDYKGEDFDDIKDKMDSFTKNLLPSYDQPRTYTILQYSDGNFSCKEVTVLPSIKYGYNICDVGATSGKIQIHFPEQELETGYKLNYQIGTSNSVLISELPYQYPQTGTEQISVPNSLTVYLADQSGNKFCEIQEAIIGGSANPFKGEIDKIEMTSDKTVELTINGNFTPPYELHMYESTKKPNYNGKPKASVNKRVIEVDISDPDKSYCFYLQRADACGATDESPDICTIPLFDVDPSYINGVNTNSVNWVKHNETLLSGDGDQLDNNRKVTTHIIYEIDGNPQPFIKTSDSKYIDAPILCEKIYCYQIETKIVDRYYNIEYESKSLSQKKCYDPKNIKREPIEDFYATVNGNAVEINIDYNTVVSLNTIDKYLLYTHNGTEYEITDESKNMTSFTYDKEDPYDASLCFKVGYEDVCGSYAELSQEVCTIHLTTDDDNHLFWTGESPFQPYDIASYELHEGTPSTFVDSFSPTMYDHAPNLSNATDVVHYRIVAVDENGNESYSNIVEIIPGFGLKLPNAFSPNGDMENDMFTIGGKPKMIAEYSFEITDRWGIKVIDFIDDQDFLINGWDGTVNGKNVPTGTYVFQLRINLKHGDQIFKKGYLHILR